MTDKGEPSSRAQQDSCAFCAIVAGQDDEAEIVVEGKEWIAFFPKTPATPGHTLVVPRRHVPDFWSLDHHLAGVLASAAVEVGRAVEAAVQPEGMNLISSKGRAAEQTVRHVHLHVLPRWEDDAVDAIWPPNRKANSAALDEVADAVRASFAAG